MQKMVSKMELDIWSGDWGLPSIDFTCLQVMAFCRFSGVPIKTIATDNPWWSLTRTLPVFRHANYHMSKFHDITAYLRNHNYNADFTLTPKDSGDVSAYTALLRQKLEPSLLYMFWIEEMNFVELIRPWYAQKLPFPTNYFIPGRIKSDAEKCINSKYGIQLSQSAESKAVIETALFSEAEKCITLLSERLSDSEFFFGKNPTSFDAIVFGYLAPLLKVPFPNAVLQNHLKACDNLVRFVNGILQKYFPTAKGMGYSNQQTQQELNKDEDDDIGEFPHKWRDIILSALFAVTAMVGYAFAVGLVNIELIDDHSDHSRNIFVPNLEDIINIEREENDDDDDNDNDQQKEDSHDNDHTKDNSNPKEFEESNEKV